MVGGGDQLADWQALARDLRVADRVHWVGSVPKTEIGVYYNLADMLAMPSVSRPADGLNVCVLDAMSCGKPVVASTVAGNPLAVVNGVTGLLVPEQDPPALAAAVAALIDNPQAAAAMGRAGRRRIEEELGWPQLARRYVRHFEQMRGVGEDFSTQRRRGFAEGAERREKRGERERERSRQGFTLSSLSFPLRPLRNLCASALKLSLPLFP